MAKHISEVRTEDVVSDLLNIQGWNTSRPPNGCVVRQNEYKGYLELADIFKGQSKTGPGDAYPDFLVIDKDTHRPLMVIEAKADEHDFAQAVEQACEIYGEACRAAGHPVIAIGIAGQDKTKIRVGVSKYYQGQWREVVYEGKSISWIPTNDDVLSLLSSLALLDLAPIIPKPEVLASKADLINRILREAHVKDEYRPAYVGAMMLALWQSRGELRKSSDYVLQDINNACEAAFSKGGKSELARSLYIDEANDKLAASAWQILATLEKLNVVTASFAHDYLGQLYEAFFRYTGGNTIGQYFTPRHVTRFMADICEVTERDVVIDPACGTGGFLVACLQRTVNNSKLRYEDSIKIIHDYLIGYESEPITAALCVANMILRGDGKTGIHKDNCFLAKDYPTGKSQVALMNPPFPHKKTDASPQQFVDRALEALEQRGRLAVILPTSLISRGESGEWRQGILSQHSLLAVCEMPDELFQPYASATTSVVLLEKGVPHHAQRKTAFVRVQYDGLTLRKGTRVARPDGKNQISDAADKLAQEPGTIGEFFDILYGQKELHSREGIPSGDSLVISPTEEYNGCYGWLDFEHLIQAPFVTVAQTGTIGEAFVQMEPCGVNDDCLILLAKEDKHVSTASLFIAAALIRLERWRFNYGRKLTPQRICNFRMVRTSELENWVNNQFERWKRIAEAAVEGYSQRDIS